MYGYCSGKGPVGKNVGFWSGSLEGMGIRKADINDYTGENERFIPRAALERQTEGKLPPKFGRTSGGAYCIALHASQVGTVIDQRL